METCGLQTLDRTFAAMELTFVDIFIKAFLLCGILYLVARHEADLHFSKLCIAAAVISVGSSTINLLLSEHIGVFSLIPSFGFMIYILMKLCWLSFKKALLASIVYTIISMLISVGLAIAMVYVFGDPESMTHSSQQEERYEEAMQFMHEMWGANTNVYSCSNNIPVVMAAMESMEEEIPAEETPPEVKPTPTPTPTATPKPTPEPTPETDEEAWAEAEKKRVFKGVMSGKNGRKAMLVNNEILHVGEVITIEHDSKLYRWQLKELGAHHAQWDRIDIRDK